ncbi:putative galactinol--sucrose galactosyltransferase 6 [Iris pallida]|uniref:galactinol--sucrose galactosyltransferase n=1 Tax=Iris pallida TaxID=29817 RepID=A0AAX6EVK6_IRIPA|nr:putative galactinol--sucrose galactosyltransferase 6 [Iris pallida]
MGTLSRSLLPMHINAPSSTPPPLRSSSTSIALSITRYSYSYSCCPFLFLLLTNYVLIDILSSSVRSSSIKPIKATGLGSINPTIKKKKKSNQEEEKMTITPLVKISNEKLVIKGRTVLSGMPDNVLTSSAVSSGPVDGVFIGASFSEADSRHVVPLGTLRGLRFVASFRFKLWWMSQKMGDKGSDVPLETQFLLLESKGNGGGGDDEDVYIVFLPLVEGRFRACLQGNARDELELCMESGDADTQSDTFSQALFVGAAGSDPFAAVSNAVGAVKTHLNTFRQRPEKRLPGIVDYFGWCTWDAFYQEVTQEGVEAGLSSLISGGVPPKFVIIDDGWQSVASDENPGSGSLQRLTGIKENGKFQSKEDPASGIKSVVTTAKEKYGLKYVYVWHAITGYWGGVRPGVDGMEAYGSRMAYPKVSPGVQENEPGMKTDSLTLQGLGLVNPKGVHKFYNELHEYLARAGVDGVKVDVQCVLETLGAGFGGRVELTRQYHLALDASVAKNFPDNGCIACMSHNTDALYCSKQTGIVRASDDFYPRDAVSHTIHIASVAYNSVFLGEFMLPDWDMFHSLHPAAEYHASARAISGGPVYVSDAPGKHNFELLRKLVLPDGSILRARLPGRPTRDCLFSDPARDAVSLLKIWNMNKFTGVLGVYNCQGAAWSATEKKNVFHHHARADFLSCAVSGSDVHLISEAATDETWGGDCAVYRHRDGELVLLPYRAAMPISLKVLEHEIFTIAPIKDLAPGFRFAPLGLVDMYNSGGAVEGLSYIIHSGAGLSDSDGGLERELSCASLQSADDTGSGAAAAVATVYMEVKGCGRFGAYSSAKPKKCSLGSSADTKFSYCPSLGLLTLQIDDMPEQGRKVHQLTIEF